MNGLCKTAEPYEQTVDEKLAAGVAGTAGPSTRSSHRVPDEKTESRGRPCQHSPEPPALLHSGPMVPPAL